MPSKIPARIPLGFGDWTFGQLRRNSNLARRGLGRAPATVDERPLSLYIRLKPNPGVPSTPPPQYLHIRCLDFGTPPPPRSSPSASSLAVLPLVPPSRNTLDHPSRSLPSPALPLPPFPSLLPLSSPPSPPLSSPPHPSSSLSSLCSLLPLLSLPSPLSSLPLFSSSQPLLSLPPPPSPLLPPPSHRPSLSFSSSLSPPLSIIPLSFSPLLPFVPASLHSILLSPLSLSFP